MGCPLGCYCGLMCTCQCLPHPTFNNSLPSDESSKNDRRRVVYILLLGAAETGKSTIMRQMKIIDSDGMSPRTLRTYKKPVLNNLFICVTKLIRAVKEAQLKWESEEAAKAADILGTITEENWGLDGEPLLPSNHAQLIQHIWQDCSAQRCWGRANEFNLPDSLAYYLNATDRLFQLGYVPSQEDVLRLRMPTDSVTVYNFNHGNLTLKITDVGGQKGQRRRWIRLFDDLNTIIFLASLSEYDQYWRIGEEEDDRDINRLQLSLQLFRETLTYRGFDRTSIILFLNKTDVLEQKVQTSDISKYFPDYSGPSNNAQSVTEFVKGKFMAHGAQENKHIYSHLTCATDTKRTKFVYAAVKDHIIWSIVKHKCEF